jgi:hypothetical protein
MRVGSKAIRKATNIGLATLMVSMSTWQTCAMAQAVPVMIGIDGIGVLASRPQVGAVLMTAGLSSEQVNAEPLLVKLPDTASRQNVTARFNFTDDKLTELLFTLDSDDPGDVKAQAERWGVALRKMYGTRLVEASVSPEGYQVEGWCVAPSVEVSTVTRGSLGVLDYVYDEFGPCRDAPSTTALQPGGFMYRLPPPTSTPAQTTAR